MNRLAAVAALACAVLLGGCQTARPLYYWGHFEPAMYQSYTAPDKMTAERQIEELQEDVQKAAGANLSVPPGLHAHLGYLYTQLGKLDLAEREFAAEVTLFPESATFVQRLVKSAPPKTTP